VVKNERKTMAAYGTFAKIYDRLMGNRDDRWLSYIFSMLRRFGILPPMKILDIGCGTGYLSIPLIEQGYRVTGTDISASMMEEAVINASARGLFLPVIQADMRELPECGRYHAITCACDPINYLSDLSDVERFLKGAYQRLYPKGVLLFDVSTPYYYRDVLGSGTFAYTEDDSAAILTTSYEENRCLMLLTLFLRWTNGLYQRNEEEHVLTAFAKEELLSLLTNTGFTGCQAYAFPTAQAAGERDQRWQFAAIRA
jgi:2-polyprenyl-3-methyl-5-hydroxy-6-metoxy-1,4-benzoquinol methylase